MDRVYILRPKNLKRVGYDARTRVLEILLTNGNLYNIYEISPLRYETFMESKSKAFHFNLFIKNRYKTKLIKTEIYKKD